MGSSSWRLDCDPPLESAGWLSVDLCSEPPVASQDPTAVTCEHEPLPTE